MTGRRRKERVYSELTGQRGRTRLVVLAGEVGGRLSEECREFLNQVRSQTGAPASAREGSPGVAAQMGASLGAARPKLLPFSAGVQERSGFRW